MASVSRNGSTTTYVYDKLGQLIRVNDPHENVTWVYNYDRGGNILSKVKYAYTTGTVGTATQTIHYTYGDSNWKDKLTAYNGTTISYDAIGNPTSDGTWTYTWQAGRQLKQMTKSGTTVSFGYDHNGLRTSKTVNGTVTNYTLHGKNIVHITQGTNWAHFFYDQSGKVAKATYNGSHYAYLYNMQGDVVGIVDSAGTEVVKYTYDAWGKLLSKTGTMASTFGTLNPFRYRGYVYDEETGLYYLRSRYYNPIWGRFLNADTVLGFAASLKNRNTFAYCDNNAVNQSDASGQVSYSITSPLGDQLMSLREESAGGGGGLAPFLFFDMLCHAIAQEERESAPAIAISDVYVQTDDPEGQRIYYGARIFSHTFQLTTSAMTCEEAVAWAYGVSALPLDQGGMGINTKWGIYTEQYSDALRIYPLLLPLKPAVQTSIELDNLILDDKEPNEYPHLHLPNRLFNNKHKHFHIWFGYIGGK